MNIKWIFIYLLITLLLTIVTQVGGVLFLISLTAYPFINNNFKRRWARVSVKWISFFIIYLSGIFIIVPPVAKYFGRVQLPLSTTRSVKPGRALTFFLNRNYVRPELKETLFVVAEKMNAEFPGTIINYLDANFPFIDKFPLPPHLSHNDGKKLDLSFTYKDANTGKYTSNLPSIIGYGVCEEPDKHDVNMPLLCDKKGFWQYNLLSEIVPQGNKIKYDFDEERTKRLIDLFSAQSSIGKIFIEPHLKKRLHLMSNKIRFHGCQAVRHDDHIHIQLK
jgi:hypothetical protein